MSKALPSYYLFEEHYKRIDVDNKKASSIAGLKKVVANACAVRLSYAFNHIEGHKIPAKPPGVYGNVWPGLKGNYILGSRGFANYLKKTYGQPAISKPADHKEKYAGKLGMVYFHVKFKDAYGHVALWDGEKGWRGQFFDESRAVWFWEMTSGGVFRATADF